MLRKVVAAGGGGGGGGDGAAAAAATKLCGQCCFGDSGDPQECCESYQCGKLPQQLVLTTTTNVASARAPRS